MKKFNKAIASIGTVTLLTAGCSFIGLGDSSEEKQPSQQTETKQDNSGNNNDENGKSSEEKSRKSNKPLLKETVKTTADGKQVVTNPESLLVCADKKRNLPADYVPKNLVVPDIEFPYANPEKYEKSQIRKVAAGSIEDLFKAAKADGIKLYGISGYRSYDRQETVFAHNVNKYGSEEEANQVSAHPGQSEHQTGLTMDVSSLSVDNHLTQKFGKTKDGKWLAEHVAEFGFIIRYPQGKQQLTGYEYEPWHIRYVGKKAAKQIEKKEITLEEYLKQ